MNIKAATPFTKLPASQTAWVKKTLQRLSLEEKVGQLVMPAFRGTYLHQTSSEFKEIERQIHQNHVGGFILFAGDVYESAILIDQMQSMAPIPLLVGSDFERGANFRIRRTVSFPWNMAIGATGSEKWAYLQGKITAQEARAMGVNWVFAPVLDVNNNPSNPVINIRSYGEDPALVARMGGAFVQGAQEAGVLATGKHFPGHGDTAVDSHLELPVLKVNRERLEQIEFFPFKQLMGRGLSAIMIAHLAVPALDPDPSVPATLSPNIIAKTLQTDLGFTGLVVTDSLSMSGLTRNYWTGEAAIRTIEAGTDVILDPPAPDVVIQALLQAVRSGRISLERLDRSVRKILQVKAWLGLHRDKRVHLSNLKAIVDSPENQSQAQQMADASVTLLRDLKGVIPIDVRRVRSAQVLLILGRDEQEETAVFEQELRARIDHVDIHRLSATTSESALAKVLAEPGKSELIICAAFARLVTGTGAVGLPETLAAWMNQVVKLEKPVATISLGNPYIVQQVPDSPNYLCTFSNADVSQRAAVKALFGEIPIQGRSPVSIPPVSPLYAGIQRPRSEMKLKVSTSASGSQWSELDQLMEASISKKAFPGASLAVGYKGELVYHKAYGRFEYSAKSPAVKRETLFDLASLTKVVATTTLAMQLCERKTIELDWPLSRFYPAFVGGGKEQVTIKHLLTHCSGLPAHLPFYKDTQGKEEFVRKILQTPLEYPPGTKAVYSDLGVILLGDIIEKVTAKSLDVLARDRIFAPLQMDHTLFRPAPRMKLQIAPTEIDPWRGHLVQGEVHDENAFAMGGVSAHAGLFSNSGDLSLFCQMLLNGGIYDHRRVVRRSTLEKFTLRQDFPVGSSRALGWDTPSDGGSSGTHLSPQSYGHTGFTGTSIWIDPSRQLFVILLTNRVYPSREGAGILEVRREVADKVVEAVEAMKSN